MFGVRYLTSYAIGSIVGIINEIFQKPDQPCFRDPKYSCMLTLGSANVHGWSVLVMTAYFDIARRLKFPTIVTLTMIGPMLAILECAFGKISKAYFGPPQRWKYPDYYCTACEGYISLLSTAYFELMGLVYWFLMYKPAISKI